MTTETHVFAPPTAEMRFWQRVLRPVLRPTQNAWGAPGRALRFAMVTPTAHLAWLSMDFQHYLFAVFHQTALARMGHRVGFPVTLVALCAALAPLGWGDPQTVWQAMIAPGPALVGALAWTAYHVFLAWVARSLAFGLIMVPLGIGLYGLGVACSVGALIGGAASPWLAVAVALAASMFVALSHALEPALPPWVTGTDRWVPVRRFLDPSQGLSKVARHALRMALAVLAGALDELWGAPRLYALSVLRDLSALGLTHARQAEGERWAEAAINSGDAALDYIGVGGGAGSPRVHNTSSMTAERATGTAPLR